MKLRYLLVALAALIAPLAIATAAQASTAPKFHDAVSIVDHATGALFVAFDERGLGNLNVDYLLSADASAVYACVNGGGNHPKAANKETVNAEVSAGASFEPKNGRVVASLSAGPPSAGDFNCPPGQTLVLASVSYTNVVLTDLTNGVTVAVADASAVLVDVG